MRLTAVDPAEFDFAIAPETLEKQGLCAIDPAPVLGHINRRFDFPEGLFDHLLFVRATKAIIRAISPPVEIPPRPGLDRVGIDFLRIDMANPRMTTSAAMTWARHARANAVDTSPRQCEQFLRREAIFLDEDQLADCTGRGFVFIRHYGHGLGVGFLESTRPEDDTFCRVRSMYPRAFAADLQNTSPFGNPL